MAVVKVGDNHAVYRDGQRKGRSIRELIRHKGVFLVLFLVWHLTDLMNQLYALNGFLDEVRVTKGLARYTQILHVAQFQVIKQVN